MIKHSYHGCFVLLILGTLSMNVAAQAPRMRAPQTPTPRVNRSNNDGASPTRVAYALPRHLQQFAQPAVDEESLGNRNSNIATVGCSEDLGFYSGNGMVGAGIADGGCSGGSCTGSFLGDCGGGCDGGCLGGCGGYGSSWSAGVEFTLVKPYFENNTAFTTSDTDDATFETLTDTDFRYNNEFAPRVWIEMLGGGDCGMRFTFWQFDYAAGDVSGSPPANGFGSISHPVFGDVDLSTTTPASVFSASSDLNAYMIDFEGTKSFGGGSWGLVASSGVRFAELEQRYSATLQNAQGLRQGSINYAHQVQGFGPTVGLRVQRPFLPGLSLFGVARGSLLFGDGTSSLTAVEDQDLANAFTTRHDMSRNDLLPIGEMQVGMLYTPIVGGMWQPYLHVAFETQHWSGAGNAYSEDGDLGFYGVNMALGLGW